MRCILGVCILGGAAALVSLSGCLRPEFQPPVRSLESLQPIYQEQLPLDQTQPPNAIDHKKKQATAPEHQKPQPRYYIITIRDTLWSIAIRHLGDGARYKEILELNPGLDPQKLPIGGKIVLPNELPQEMPQK